MMMACNCGTSRRTDGSARTYTHTAPDGTKTTYAKESQARLAASREGGRVTPN